MSLSDCVKCYDTPCSCGYGYSHMALEGRINLSAAILGITSAELAVALRTVDLMPTINAHIDKQEEEERRKHYHQSAITRRLLNPPRIVRRKKKKDANTDNKE